MLITENFELEELVSPEIWQKYHGNSIWFLDRRIYVFLETIRKNIKSEIIINTWHYTDEQIQALNKKCGTNYDLKNRETQRGFREVNSQQSTVNSEQLNITGDDLSQHRFGRAVDFDVMGMSGDAVRQHIKQNWMQYRILGVSAIELNINWVHVDFRLFNYDKIPLTIFEFSK